MKSEERHEECCPAPACRPFIKWVGGKTQLISELTRRLPLSFNRYFEPFVGGGALFFSLQPKTAFLSDINDELINAYLVVRDRVESLIRSLRRHTYEEDYYYNVRAWDRDPSYSRKSAAARAARLIYLNKTCYNGLYRVNAKGHFNVPFGEYNNPTILDASNLRECSRVLFNATIDRQGFLDVEKQAKKGDFVYFDPPYAPLSATSKFTSYASGGFGADEQKALRDVCIKLDRKGVKFMLSNSSAPLILELYKRFNVEFVKANRFVNSKVAGRGKINEVIVRNYI